MTTDRSASNRVRQFREAQGITQAELAQRAGVSRTAVTAIEACRLSPSVTAALGISAALGATVEQLFGGSGEAPQAAWAWLPANSGGGYWEAEVAGQEWLYPAETRPMWTPPPDGAADKPPGNRGELRSRRHGTLVIAGCDPAAGLLAGEYNRQSNLRMLVLPRSSRQALELLADRKVHAAALHYSTPDAPDRNALCVRERLGSGYVLLTLASWQDGVAAARSARVRSADAAARSRLTWIGREAGSGARTCQDLLLSPKRAPAHVASHHRAVAEAVASGLVGAGVCLHLAAVEAGLDFFPVQKERYELCLPAALLDDPRVQLLVKLARSPAYRELYGNLPGYDVAQAGDLRELK